MGVGRLGGWAGGERMKIPTRREKCKRRTKWIPKKKKIRSREKLTRESLPSEVHP
jgi:hypothetical protein